VKPVQIFARRGDSASPVAMATGDRGVQKAGRSGDGIGTARITNRLCVLVAGYTGNQLQVWLFDYVLYPFVIWRAGLGWGLLIMAVLSFLLCWSMLRFYDWSGQDWLGIEAVKRLRESRDSTGWRGRLGRLLRRSDLLAFVVLSLRFDPLITTLYLRPAERAFRGLSGSDWRLFVASVALSNVYWSLVAYGGIELVRSVWESGAWR
jgi:hypothetical protein